MMTTAATMRNIRLIVEIVTSHISIAYQVSAAPRFQFVDHCSVANWYLYSKFENFGIFSKCMVYKFLIWYVWKICIYLVYFWQRV